jgi:CdiI immunity protein
MTSGRGRRPTLSAQDVPALADFVRAYLHQDVLVEHGSAAEAVRAFCRDASRAEATALVRDFARLITTAADWPVAAVTRLFRDDLGAAWAPESFDDLVQLAAAAAGAPRRPR